VRCCCWSYTDANGHVDLKFEIKFVFWVAFNLKKKIVGNTVGSRPICRQRLEGNTAATSTNDFQVNMTCVSNG